MGSNSLGSILLGTAGALKTATMMKVEPRSTRQRRNGIPRGGTNDATADRKKITEHPMQGTITASNSPKTPLDGLSRKASSASGKGIPNPSAVCVNIRANDVMLTLSA